MFVLQCPSSSFDVNDVVTSAPIHVHFVEKNNLHSSQFLLLFSTEERTSYVLVWEWPDATSDIVELVYVQNAWGLWPANGNTHAEMMPPKLTEGRVGPTTVTAARCTPLACPSPYGARSDALYSHPAQTHWHAEPFLEARRDRLASLLFPQGVAFSPTTVEWNKAVGDEREQPTQLLGGKGSAVSFYGMLPWLASSFSIIISIIFYDTSCGLLIKCSFSFLFSVTSAGLQSLIRSMFQHLSAQTHLKQMEGAGNDG